MKAPGFWRDGGIRLPAFCLAPLGLLYGLATCVRWRITKPATVGIPVICIGNAVMGGAGKTPVALTLARHLIAAGWNPHFLSRGYGGTLAEGNDGAIRVERGHHGAADVGDEPLLLAATAPTWVAPNRPAGARAAEAAGADILIMDDGYQNPSLAKDLNILVIDGGYGFGNGKIFPAGPLRELRGMALSRADAVVLFEPVGEGLREGFPDGLPVHTARLISKSPPTLAPGQPVLAFCGIGRPEKFFDALADCGLKVVETRAFSDHHLYSDAELSMLSGRARSLDATLVTTDKDAVRIDGDRHPGIAAIGASVEFTQGDVIARLLAPVMKSGPNRANNR